MIGHEAQVVRSPAMRTFTPNPPWVGRVLEQLAGPLQEHIPPEWHPILASDKPGAWQAQELGCGGYGCVVPTHDPTVVLKLTTDDTEAEFAGQWSKFVAPNFCVDYRLIMSSQVTDDQGRRVFLLWRDAADHVGKMRKVLSIRAAMLVERQHRAAKEAYRAAVQKTRLVVRLAQEWAHACQEMANQTEIPELQPLGAGMLQTWTDHGVLFGDVREANLGFVNGFWEIIDPGHIAIIDRAGAPPTAVPGDLPESAANVLYRARPHGPARERKFAVEWADQSGWSLTSRTQAFDWFKDAMPDGFTPAATVEDHRAYALLRGIPLDMEAIQPNSLYVVRPHELAERKLLGTDLQPQKIASIQKAWRSLTELPPLEIDYTSDGTLHVEDGNHRLQVAAESDSPVAVHFRPVGLGWQPISSAASITDRILNALPGTIPSDR